MMIVCLLFCLVFLPWAADAATYYVAKTGSDATACASAQSPASPKKTMNAGARCLRSGDTLLVNAGTYAEQLLDVVPSGTASNPTRIQANGNATLGTGDTVMIRPPRRSGYTQVVRFTNKRHIIFDGFIVDATNIFNIAIFVNGTSRYIIIQNSVIQNMPGRDGDHTGGAGISFYKDSGFNTARNNVVHDIGMLGAPSRHVHGFYSKGHDNVIENNRVYHNSGHGIHVYAGIPLHRITVRNNVVYNNRLGPGILNASNNGVVANNIVYGNKKSGITLGGYSSGRVNHQAYNNTIYANGGACIQIGSQYRTADRSMVHNNICWKNGSNAVSNRYGTNSTIRHNFTADPKFVNASGGNFYLEAGSLAKTASETGGEVGVYGGEGTPGPGFPPSPPGGGTETPSAIPSEPLSMPPGAPPVP